MPRTLSIWPIFISRIFLKQRIARFQKKRAKILNSFKSVECAFHFLGSFPSFGHEFCISRTKRQLKIDKKKEENFNLTYLSSFHKFFKNIFAESRVIRTSSRKFIHLHFTSFSKKNLRMACFQKKRAKIQSTI